MSVRRMVTHPASTAISRVLRRDSMLRSSANLIYEAIAFVLKTSKTLNKTKIYNISNTKLTADRTYACPAKFEQVGRICTVS